MRHFSLVSHRYNSAIKELELFTNVYGLKTMANDLLKSIKARYADFKRVKQYSLATILDRMLKTAFFLSSENVTVANELLVEEALELGIEDGVEKASTSKASKVSRFLIDTSYLKICRL